MMSHVIVIERHPNGLRLRLLGQRVHHGAVGIILGTLLALHDRRDWHEWFKLGG